MSISGRASQVAIVLVVLTTGAWAATAYVAAEVSHSSALGSAWFVVGTASIYPPWAWLLWAARAEDVPPRVLAVASSTTCAATLVAMLIVGLGAGRRRAPGNSGAYGTARWATEAELEDGGLLHEDGVVLCQTESAVYERVAVADSGAVAWRMLRAGRLVRHNGPEHVFCFAPTRSGKGVGLVIPTLLSWTGSAIIYDIKKELWAATAGWRRGFSRTWRFEPSALDSVRFNPLDEIRRGDLEVRDAQNVADILVDPEGAMEKRDHWQTAGHAFLVGAILHVLYAEKDKSLAGLAAFLSDPSRTQIESLERMMTTAHLPSGPHPIVAATAREMLNRSENELSGVFSTAMTCLSLYRDPVIARSTSTSDFRLTDLMHADHPVSLYLVIPPSDIDRLRPLVRLMLNQIGRRLTETMATGTQAPVARRLLMMLDEFPSLGRLSFFETELAYLAGYGIKCFLIAQSLSQIERAYGAQSSILDNAHVRVTYGALDERTAKRISELLGQGTATRKHVSFGGKRGAMWFDHVTESEHEHARPLLTPGEVLQLPGDQVLLLVGGLAPYRGRKVMYYQDPRFRQRAWLPPPDAPEQQTAELLPRRSSDWEGFGPNVGTQVKGARESETATASLAVYSLEPEDQEVASGDEGPLSVTAWDGFFDSPDEVPETAQITEAEAPEGREDLPL